MSIDSSISPSNGHPVANICIYSATLSIIATYIHVMALLLASISIELPQNFESISYTGYLKLHR